MIVNVKLGRRDLANVFKHELPSKITIFHFKKYWDISDLADKIVFEDDNGKEFVLKDRLSTGLKLDYEH